MSSSTSPLRRRLYGLPVTVAGVVSIPVRYRSFLPVRHVGLVSDRMGADGQPCILHASERFGGAVETSATDFVRHRAGPLCYHGHLGNLHPTEVMERARADLGTPYHITQNNCEHFATRAAGEEASSPQLAAGITASTFLLGVLSSVVGGVIVSVVGASRGR
jgi:hypothetical protein